MKKINLGNNKYTLVDDIDYLRFGLLHWHIVGIGKHKYVLSNIVKYIDKRLIFSKNFFLHRLILNASKNDVIDHINGDGLDNRRANLRFCTHAENMMNKKIYKNNKSGYKGVHFDIQKNKWRALIRKNSHNIHIGYYDDKIKAAEEYDKKAKQIFGNFSNLNFL